MFTTTDTLGVRAETTGEAVRDDAPLKPPHFLSQVMLIPAPVPEMVVSFCLISFGLVGNTLNIWVIGAMKENAVFLYLKALAGCDVISCVTMALTLYHRVIGSASTSYSFEWFYTYLVLPMVLTMPLSIVSGTALPATSRTQDTGI